MSNQGKWNNLLKLRNNYLKDSEIRKKANSGKEMNRSGIEEELFVGSVFIGDVLKFDLQEMHTSNHLKRMGIAVFED